MYKNKNFHKNLSHHIQEIRRIKKINPIYHNQHLSKFSKKKQHFHITWFSISHKFAPDFWFSRSLNQSLKNLFSHNSITTSRAAVPPNLEKLKSIKFNYGYEKELPADESSKNCIKFLWINDESWEITTFLCLN